MSAMDDERVDRLLKDLDAALSVEPSPALAAKVRRRIDDRVASTWMVARRWAVAAALMLAAGVTYVRWAQPASESSPTNRMAVVEVARPAPETLASESEHALRLSPHVDVAATSPTPSRRLTSERNRTQVVVTGPEPVVIVSPATRLGMEQLQRAVAAGRITAASFSSELVSIEPSVVTPTIIELSPVGVLTAPVDASGVPDDPSGASSWPNRLPGPAPLFDRSERRSAS